ncbi:MAG: hypothetical protein LBE16_05610 [Clostridiales Family XIII bacterium]|jgi:hypothetical protein|nr:hypothetical protein [Clostridiales Family XIII bacterium]
MAMKRILIVALVLAMMFSASSVAFATVGDPTGSTAVDGNGNLVYVDTVVYSVVLPTDATLDFTVDPQGLLDLDANGATVDSLGGGKIVSKGQAFFVNNSSVPVVLGVSLKVAGTALSATGSDKAMTFPSNTAYVDANSAPGSKKANNLLFYAVLAATDITDTNALPASIDAATAAFVFDSIGIGGSDTNKLQFLLDQAEYTVKPEGSGYTIGQTDVGNGSGLQIAGLVNDKADWTNYTGASPTNVLKVSAVFDYAAQAGTEAKSTTYTAPQLVENIFATVTVASTDWATVSTAPSVSSDISTWTAASTAVVTINLGIGASAATGIDLAASKINYTNNAGVRSLAFNASGMAQYFEYDNSARKLTLNPDFFALLKAGTDVTVDVQFTDGSGNLSVETVTITG